MEPINARNHAPVAALTPSLSAVRYTNNAGLYQLTIPRHKQRQHPLIRAGRGGGEQGGGGYDGRTGRDGEEISLHSTVAAGSQRETHAVFCTTRDAKVDQSLRPHHPLMFDKGGGCRPVLSRQVERPPGESLEEVRRSRRVPPGPAGSRQVPPGPAGLQTAKTPRRSSYQRSQSRLT